MNDSSWNGWAPVPLRLMLGFGFMYHGYPKLFTSEGHQNFLGMLNDIGVPAAGMMSWVVALVEFFGGLALVLGAFVAIAAALNLVSQLVAMFTVHLPHGFNFLNITGMSEQGMQFGMPGYEVNLLYIAGLSALIVGGAGALSIDRARRGKNRPVAGAGSVGS